MTDKQKENLGEAITGSESALEKMYTLAKSGANFTDYYKLKDRMNIEDKERASKERTRVRSDVVKRYSGKQQEAMYKALFTDTYYDKYIKYGKKANVPADAFFEVLDLKYSKKAKQPEVIKKLNSYKLNDKQWQAIFDACYP
jgi:hypothetical protein